MALPHRQQRQDAVFQVPYQSTGPSSGVSGSGYGAVDYAANGRYGVPAPGVAAPMVMPYPVAGHMPGQHMGPYPQIVLPAGSADDYEGSRAAASLAEGLANTVVLSPMQNAGGGVPSPTRGYYSQPPGYPYYPMQPVPPPGRGAGGRMGMQQAGGRGRGGNNTTERRQQQRRRKVQKGLEDNVRRTVYISYIDQQVTEESLATFFQECGTVMDCRICGDPNSAMRFAFIEFMEEAGAQKALSLSGSMLGSSPLRVLASRTAIVPVNKELMPRSHTELERCSRTVYVANIDKKVDRDDVRNFFEHLCGKVAKIRLLGDFAHSTRIAFIEFMTAEGAMAALNCSGALLGSLPLRVSPSKTPVRGDKEGDKEPPGVATRPGQVGSSNGAEAVDGPAGLPLDSGSSVHAPGQANGLSPAVEEWQLEPAGAEGHQEHPAEPVINT